MTIGERIRNLRIERNMSQDELAQRAGYKSRSSINKIELSGQDLPMSKVRRIAIVLGTTPEYLLGWDGPPSFNNIVPFPKMTQIPLVGSIACGEPIVANQEWEETVDLPEHVHADFALRAHGDSMINARIYDGDIVYIRQQSTVDDGDIAAVVIEDSATLKKVHFYEDHIVLQAENPQVRPLVYWGQEMDNVHIIGKAVAFTSMLRR